MRQLENLHKHWICSLSIVPHIDVERLKLQLQMLGDAFRGAALCETVQDVAAGLSRLHSQTRSLFVEAEKRLKLCLYLPVSIASSERSCSTLKRLKTWLRSSMSQKRLTHLTLIHVHADIIKQLNIVYLIKEFIGITPERQATFVVL